jgi:uncharacterized protein
MDQKRAHTRSKTRKFILVRIVDPSPPKPVTSGSHPLDAQPCQAAWVLAFLRENGGMKKIFSIIFVWAIASAALAQGSPQLDLPHTKISAGMYLIDTQVAGTPEQREIGLMFRQQMPQGEGMLFVFERPGEQCFWMKNTLLPLTAAFVADDGTIVNLEDMKPQTTDSHCSAKPVRFVLEMNQGWFKKKGIKAGVKLGGVPFGGQ